MSSLEFLTRFVLPRCFRKSNHGRNGDTFLYFEQEVNKDILDGYQSEITAGRIVYKDASGRIHKTPPMLLKVFPASFSRSIFTELTFANEILVYNKILPFYATLNDSIWKLFPKFFFGDLIFSDENEDGFVALEDLRKNEFFPAKSRTFLDIAHLRLMMKKLGEFHAYSYLAKSMYSRQFYRLVDNLTETYFIVINTMPKFLNALHEIYFDLLCKDERYAKKVKHLQEIIVNAEHFVAEILTTRNEPMAVLCHGDFLRNNILFQYDSENNPVDAKFIDVGNMRYCSPVVDLGLVLYMNSDQITRDEYWEELMDTYHESLKNTFPHNIVPSKTEFLTEFKRNVLQTYLVAMFFLPAMFRQNEIKEGTWFSELFSPDYEEYEGKPLQSVSEEAVVDFLKKLHVGKSKEAVLDIIRDILNKNFI